MIRDILDYQGTKIGELELPDDTPESVWSEKLSKYSKAPDTYDVLGASIVDRKKFADELLERFKKKNIQDGINALQGFWMHHKLRDYSVTFYGVNFKIDIMNLAISGDLEIACLALIYGETDDMSLPYHWLSSSRKLWLISELKSYLGWA